MIDSILLAQSFGEKLPYMLIGALGFIVAFGLAVFIHELGHFLAAKAFGVPVERFVIGFDKEAMPFLPRCLFEFKVGETTYGLSAVPLGGYVKMSGVIHPEIEKYLEGEEKPKGGHPTDIDAAVPLPVSRIDGPAPATDKNTLQGQAMQDMAALYKKPFWQKTIIYSAGVIMNLLLAMVVVTLLTTRGYWQAAPMLAEVAWIAPDSMFADKVQVGDQVVAINGDKIKNADELYEKLDPVLAKEAESHSFTLSISRGGTGSTFELPVELPKTEKAHGDFIQTFVKTPAYIEMVVINSVADKAGLKKGDVIAQVNGQPIEVWHQFTEVVRASAGVPVVLSVQRGDKFEEITVVPSESPAEEGIGQVGVLQGNRERIFVQKSLPQAAADSPGAVLRFTQRYIANLKRLGGHAVSGNIGVVRQELGGPVGIAQLAYRQAQNGLNDWLQFVILLNVALAVMNILPIPVLDGGHICFAIYEAIFKRPVPPKVLVPLLNGAVIFFLLFFVLVTFNDVLKIFL